MLPEPDEARRQREQEQERLAWGSWRQDRELNRRKVLRALVGLVVVIVASALLAYGCDAVRGPQQLKLEPSVAGLSLQPPTDETEQLRGSFEAAGAVGPAAGRYTDGRTSTLFVVGIGQEIPITVLSGLLPASTADLDYDGPGGPVTCGPTADGSRCLWKNGDLVGGTAARGTPPEALAALTRELRGGAVRR
jgi:hypothetical protein